MARKKVTDRRERNTAIHEAGHAVASFYLQQRIRRATIVPDSDSLGHVKHTPLQFGSNGVFDDSLRGVARAEARILICYAGPLAERKFQPRSRWRLHGGADFENAGELMARLQGTDAEYNRLYAALLWRRAELIVDLRWKDINAVADALLAHRTLDLDGVRAAIDSAYGLKPLALNRAGTHGVLAHG